MLKFLTKNYWWITAILIGLAIILDLSYDTIETVKTPVTITSPEGEQQTVFYVTLKDTYQLIRACVNILYSLGITLLVLVAIDKRIDTEESKKYKEDLDRLNEKIHNNIFDGVLNKIVPLELFDQVKKDIFKTDVIRKNAKWTYQISHHNGSYILNQTIQYEIENLTDGKIEKEIPIQLLFTSPIVDTKITYWKIKTLTGITEREEKVNFDKLTVLLERRETKKIELNVTNTYKNAVVMDSHVSNFSIIGLEISVQKPADVEFTIMPSFTTPIVENRPNNQLITYDKIPCILLGQGIAYMIVKANSVA